MHRPPAIANTDSPRQFFRPTASQFIIRQRPPSTRSSPPSPPPSARATVKRRAAPEDDGDENGRPVVRPSPVERTGEVPTAPAAAIRGHRRTLEGPHGMPYTFSWLPVEGLAQSSVEGVPEWLRAERQAVVMAKLQIALGGEMSTGKSADYLLAALPPGNYPNDQGIRGATELLSTSSGPRSVLSYEFLWACHQAGRLVETEGFRITSMDP
ncbi:hypothetical protein DB88DRAFT_499594 [Papiliotrema laurentii]|uniref:Uncharacterized protein n=1 Tax=Papiliotrema laurentii TaxID=5418 RepID=A0AAD9FPX5_PAPLA|nr:hypothetical protein DB88DRAFT_499594 [Papiliotrema laurentii]